MKHGKSFNDKRGAKNSDGRAGVKVGASQEKQSMATDPGLFCFINIAHFHGIPADPEQIAHALAIDSHEGMSEGDMLRAAKSLKLKARAATVKYSKLAKLPLPAVVGLEKEKYAILAQIVEGKMLMLMPGGTPPKVISAKEFQKNWTGRVLLFAPRFWQETDRKFNLK